MWANIEIELHMKPTCLSRRIKTQILKDAYLMKLTNWEVNKMNDNRLKGIAVILFGILLSASGEEMNRTVLASFSDFPFALIGIMVGIVGLIMVFKNNKE